jgi:hypothetical protein
MTKKEKLERKKIPEVIFNKGDGKGKVDKKYNRYTFDLPISKLHFSNKVRDYLVNLYMIAIESDKTSDLLFYLAELSLAIERHNDNLDERESDVISYGGLPEHEKGFYYPIPDSHDTLSERDIDTILADPRTYEHLYDTNWYIDKKLLEYKSGEMSVGQTLLLGDKGLQITRLESEYPYHAKIKLAIVDAKFLATDSTEEPDTKETTLYLDRIMEDPHHFPEIIMGGPWYIEKDILNKLIPNLKPGMTHVIESNTLEIVRVDSRYPNHARIDFSYKPDKAKVAKFEWSLYGFESIENLVNLKYHEPRDASVTITDSFAEVLGLKKKGDIYKWLGKDSFVDIILKQDLDGLSDIPVNVEVYK